MQEKIFSEAVAKHPKKPKYKVLQSITKDHLSQDDAISKANKLYRKPAVREHIKRLNTITKSKHLRRLESVYKASMKKKTDAQGNEIPTNLSSAVSSLNAINALIKKPKIKIDIPRVQDGEAIILALLQQFADRKIDKEDMEVMLKGIETLSAFRVASKVEQQLLGDAKQKIRTIFDE